MSGDASDALHDPAATDIRGRRDQLAADEGPPVVEALETYRLTVNGRERAVEGAWIGESLLWVLRERLGLPGSKNACEQGECGSCSVYLDGQLVCACLVLAGQAEPFAQHVQQALALPHAVGLARLAVDGDVQAHCSFQAQVSVRRASTASA